MDSKCKECQKRLESLLSVQICCNCKNIFCEKHIKDLPSKDLICRHCLIGYLKRKALNEFSLNPLYLSKELKSLKAFKLNTKEKIDKKEVSFKRLTCQLALLKVSHIEIMKSFSQRLSLIQSSNFSLQQAHLSLIKAASDIKDCVSLKNRELALSLNTNSKLNTEKTSLDSEVARIEKIIENLLNNVKGTLQYQRVRAICCVKCTGKLKSLFRKPSSSLLSQENRLSKASIRSLPSYKSDSCKCSVF